MGSSVSVVLAELFMQSVEEKIFENAPCRPLIWKRYLDDIFCILPRDMVDSFFNHINCQNQHIKFTVELEENKSIPFLDLLITRKEDGSLMFDIFRKPMNNGNYLKFSSNHPMNHKRAVVRSLVDRANKLCSEEVQGKEINIIKATMKKNDYPKKFVDNIVNERKSSNNNNNRESERSVTRYVSTPYIKGTSERANHVLKKYNIRLSNKPSNTLHKQLNNTKDKRPPLSTSNCVYKIKCRDCDHVYIGETRKTLQERVKQHESNVRHRSSTSLVYQHCSRFNHSMQFDNAKVVINNERTRSRRYLESFHSFSNSHALNRYVEFSEIYKPIIKETISKINIQN